MMGNRKVTEYALYKGENLLHIGTIADIAKKENVLEDTIRFYRTPTHKKRVSKRKNARNYRMLVELEDDE